MKVKVNLGLSSTSIPDKIQNARIYADNLDLHTAEFPNPDPTAAALRTAATDLEVTYGAAQNGTSADTANMHDDEAILDALVKKLSHYAEDRPNCTPALIVLLGMVVKASGGNYGGVFGGRSSAIGCASLRTPAVKGACYIFQKFQGLNPPAETDWQYEGTCTHVAYEAAGLTSIAKYWFRVIPVVGQVHGTPSAAISIVIM